MIHLYTGNGKGKTTAALGLAMRAAGAGQKVFIAQFVKGLFYSEIETIKRIPEIELRQYGLDCFIENEPTQLDIDAAQQGLEETRNVISAGIHDVFILDEICIALHFKLFTIEEFQSLVDSVTDGKELILTGRYATDELYEVADLITEMNEVKHYFTKGIQARKGIEY
jgi:cob(I)alamin adenosyltransferase